MTLQSSTEEGSTNARWLPAAIRSLVAVAMGFSLLAGLSVAAQATENFHFTYAGDGVSGHGWLAAEQVAPGTWLALSGVDITTGGPIAGTLTLAANPNPPGELYSPSGYFLFDNLFYPGSDPVIDNGGLLFANGSGGEINLFSYGPDDYTHYDNTGFNVPITFDLAGVPETTSLSFTSTGVPEPASLAILGAGVLGLTLAHRRRHSK